MTPSEQKSCSSLAPGLNQGDDGDTAPDVEALIVSLKASSGPQGKDRVSGFVVKHVVGLGPERLVGLPEPLSCWGQSIDESSLVAWPHGPPLGTCTRVRAAWRVHTRASTAGRSVLASWFYWCALCISPH